MWTVKGAARRYAMDGQLAELLATAKQQANTPAAQQSVKLTGDAALALLAQTPIDCDVYVRLTGHRNAEGNGEVALVFCVRAHQNPGEDFDPEAIALL